MTDLEVRVFLNHWVLRPVVKIESQLLFRQIADQVILGILAVL
jgi:hypothetical protein